jgi:hypothetical protein
VNPAAIRRRDLRLLAGITAALTLAALIGAAAARAALPDERGWEMVSPIEKNGGQVDPPGGIAGGGVLQAAAAGGAATYGSAVSFGPDATGAPPASQYLSVRDAGGWPTQNISVAVVSGSYDLADQGAPYQIFSPDLARGLLFNGKHCRGDQSGCAVANPPLAGTDAPVGYQNYYLREGTGFEALIGSSDIAGLGLDPDTFDVHIAGASRDLRTVVLATCSRLAVAAADGCGSGKNNLYKWTQGGGLALINGVPGARLASQLGAVSEDGSRIYWTDVNSGNLFLNEAGTNTQVDGAAGGGGSFQTASTDGSVLFYSKGGHLWRGSGATSADLTPSGGVAGVLGASPDGSVVYFQDAAGLERWAGGVTTIAPGADAADPSTYPPATGAARVSGDGSELVFVSKASLTGFDNTDANSGLPDSEVFLYDASGAGLTCISCNPRDEAPVGDSTIPGAIANGTAPESLAAYKPRVLSANGRRVFFDSRDGLVQSDSNANPISGEGVNDVYQWEAEGEGDCAKEDGCVAAISNGSLPDGAQFIDASADGADVFFLTGASLVEGDPGSLDLYDARVGGGLPPPRTPISCEGDACQVLPPVPRTPTLATVVPGLGNPDVVYHKYCRKGYVKRKEICVRRKKHRRKHHRSKHRRHTATRGGRHR